MELFWGGLWGEGCPAAVEQGGDYREVLLCKVFNSFRVALVKL